MTVSGGALQIDSTVCTTSGNCGTPNTTSATNGSITGLNVSSEDIRLNSTNGTIDLEVAGDKDDYEVFMDTTNGDMIYDGIEVSQEHFNTDGIHLIELDTTNGDVRLSFKE